MSKEPIVWLDKYLKRSKNRDELDEHLSLNLKCVTHGSVTHWKCPKCVDEEINNLKIENQRLSTELSMLYNRHT
jgi:hypothetical protein